MFLINFQLWARNREILGTGSFYIREGFNVCGRDYRKARMRSLSVLEPVNPQLFLL